VPRQHEGGDAAENLALACHHCNLHKGPNLSGLDPQTGELTRLFHPRRDRWPEHFSEHDGEVTGLTAIGRATAKLFTAPISGSTRDGSARPTFEVFYRTLIQP
jgi:hypothetical protein